MKVSELFSIYHAWNMGDRPTREVAGITADHREVNEGFVFIAVRGHKVDGHHFLPQVCAQKPAAVVVEDASAVPKDFTGAVVTVPNGRKAVEEIASHFYGNPTARLFCVGITGTNGKTSTSLMVEKILNDFGWPTGVMGTIDHHLGHNKWESHLTTPDPITLHKRLREFVDLGAKAAVFEVSSHALQQGRADSIQFDAVVFTQLTRDHLDYHGDMQSYFAAKEKLFRDLPWHSKNKMCTAVINVSDPWGVKIQVADLCRRWTYGESKSDFQFQVLENSFAGTRYTLKTSKGEFQGRLSLPGRHNVYNAVAAIAVGVAAGRSMESCMASLQDFTGVPGRLERVPNQKGLHVFVDYAHTDDAIRTVLSALREIRRQSHGKNRIHIVFGCGGDRDKGKRPLMAQAALEGADFLYVTSDNPRGEGAMDIISDILAGIPSEEVQNRVTIEVDRREAIRKAIMKARPDDVILIAGKGHEDYQIVGDKKFSFHDATVAKGILDAE